MLNHDSIRIPAETTLELFCAVLTMERDNPKRNEAIQTYASATGQTIEDATRYINRYIRAMAG